MANYLAVVQKGPRSGFAVSFPDFPSCTTAGRTIEDTKKKAHDVLGRHIRALLEKGDKIPSPSKLEDIISVPGYSDAATIFVVTAAEAKPRVRSIRINITVPEDVLGKIDIVAQKRGMSRSAFLVHAAQNAMRSRKNEL